MNLKLILPLLLVAAAVGFFVLTTSESTPSPSPTSATQEEIDTTASFAIREPASVEASFAIFTNGTFRIFTDSKYHNLSLDVYIESSNPNVVHVKKTGITWGDFFKTLPMELTKDCLTTGTGQTFCTNNKQSLKLHINDQLDMNALDKTIQSGDKLIVRYE